MMENKQIRRDKWTGSNRIVTRSYKIKKEIADQFSKACEKAGVSKKSQIEKMMLEFITYVNSIPAGYKLEKNEIVIDQNEAEIITEKIFKNAQKLLKEM